MAYRFAFLIVIFSTLVSSVSPQSGRVKPGDKPEPVRPRVVYPPAEINSDLNKEKPSVKPTPVTNTEDDDIIKVEAALVPIPASITDIQGRAVGNLRIEDFELMIDDKAAEISEISRSQSPVRLALLFDNSSSVLQAREFEKKAAIRFFRQVIRPDKDLAALFSIASISRLEQPLTKDVSQLVDSINNFAKPEGATALLDGVIKAADYLRGVEGRRVIIIVSDGEDTLSDSTFEETIKAAQQANCQIYIVKTTDFENYKSTGIRGGNANIRALTAERRMQDLAAQTGGAVYAPIDENELNQSFARISAELSEQYILSYYPSEQTSYGQFRTIALRIKNKDNLTVRTRKGYYVSKRN